jgi:hypothetical protein
MKYVLDVNVALKWVLNEVDSPEALRLRDGWRGHMHIKLMATFGLGAQSQRVSGSTHFQLRDAAQSTSVSLP